MFTIENYLTLVVRLFLIELLRLELLFVGLPPSRSFLRQILLAELLPTVCACSSPTAVDQ